MERKDSKIMSADTLSLVQVALMIAMTTLVTMTIRVPIFSGYTHLGDSMIFLAAILLGRKKAFVSASVGMLLADIISGYMMWAPFTFVIKGTMAFIAGTIAYRANKNGESMINNIFGFVVAGIWMVLAYLVASGFITAYLMSQDVTFIQGLIVSLRDVPANCLEVIVGILIAIPMCKLIKKSKIIG
ncbi:MAG: ECF transporter S component [Clostridiaceae bacterium]